MTDDLDLRARRASAAVDRGAERLGGDGLAGVVARAHRPRAPGVLALVLVVVVTGVVLRTVGGEPTVGLGGPTPAPTLGTDPTPEPSPFPTPTPAPDLSAPPRATPTMPERDEPAPAVTATPDPTPTGSPPDPGPTPSGDPAPPTAPLGDFGMAPVTGGGFPGGGGEVARLTDVRVAPQDGFDRVVLELEGPDAPSYLVELTAPPVTAEGSGDIVPLEGEAVLRVLLTPATGVRDDGAGGWEPTYTGPARVSSRTAVVTEVVRTGDFEVVLGWAVGLRAAAPFSVTLLADPLRLVIDVAHP